MAGETPTTLSHIPAFLITLWLSGQKASSQLGFLRGSVSSLLDNLSFQLSKHTKGQAQTVSLHNRPLLSLFLLRNSGRRFSSPFLHFLASKQSFKYSGGLTIFAFILPVSLSISAVRTKERHAQGNDIQDTTLRSDTPAAFMAVTTASFKTPTQRVAGTSDGTLISHQLPRFSKFQFAGLSFFLLFPIHNNHFPQPQPSYHSLKVNATIFRGFYLIHRGAPCLSHVSFTSYSKRTPLVYYAWLNLPD